MIRSPSRIALVSSHYPPTIGGLERHVAGLAATLAKRDVEVEVIAPEAVRPPAAPREAKTGEDHVVTVRRFAVVPSAGRFLLSPALWLYLRRSLGRYDLIHVHNSHAFPFLAGTLSGSRPLVVTPLYHGGGHTIASRLLERPHRRLAKTVLYRATSVICISDAEARLVADHFPGAAGKIEVVHSGLDVDVLRPDEPSDRAPLVVTVGRLERYKRVELVLEAMQFMPIEWRLAVIGDGRDRKRLEQLSLSMGLGQRVSFIGPVSDESLRGWLRSARAFVTMSEREAFGLALAEAAVAGAALFASDIPPHREVVKLLHPERHQLLPAHTGPETLARAIGRTAAQSANGNVRLDLSWDRMADATLEVYERALRTSMPSSHPGGWPNRERLGRHEPSAVTRP